MCYVENAYVPREKAKSVQKQEHQIVSAVSIAKARVQSVLKNAYSETSMQHTFDFFL